MNISVGFRYTFYLFVRARNEEYKRAVLILSRNINIEDIEHKKIFDLSLNVYASVYSTGMKLRAPSPAMAQVPVAASLR